MIIEKICSNPWPAIILRGLINGIRDLILTEDQFHQLLRRIFVTFLQCELNTIPTMISTLLLKNMCSILLLYYII